MGSIEAENEKTIQTVAIVGAGPSGLAAAKYVLAEQRFSKVIVFEQRSSVGGLWIHSPCDDDNVVKVPQTDPHVGPDKPLASEDSSNLMFMSPVYDRLETNIPRGLMGFSDLDWSQQCQLFPKHEEVLAYLERYAKDVKHLIEFETQVLDVEPLEDGRWSVTTRKLHSTHPNNNVEVFDAVIVASGHFNVPCIPPVDGIEAWQQAFPGSISHSKFFRRPEVYVGQKVVVVGNSASGIDIAAQIRQTCKLPLIQSSTSESYLSPGAVKDQLEKPRITRFDAERRIVHFVDGSVESNVDTVLYCTGYLYSYPFLEKLRPSVVSDGVRVENLYQHIFYRPNPTLTFIALNQKVIPFPVSEAQSAVVAAFYAQRISLPGHAEMERWEQDTLSRTPRPRDFHVLKFPKDADYINELHDWAVNSPPQNDSIGQEHQSRKISPYWKEKDYWVREQFPAIKKAFQSLGERRHGVRTLEEIGFDFRKR